MQRAAPRGIVAGKIRHVESMHARALMRWVASMESDVLYPGIELIFHIPNGGKRSKVEASRLKAEGVRRGVSDYLLPVARRGFHGLWIELKAPIECKPSVEKAQRIWQINMRREGYLAEVAYGWDQARRFIERYYS